MNERLLQAIDDRRDDVVALTADLIRFPTINPPGEAYRPCAEYIGARLRKRGFETEFIRAEGTPVTPIATRASTSSPVSTEGRPAPASTSTRIST